MPLRTFTVRLREDQIITLRKLGIGQCGQLIRGALDLVFLRPDLVDVVRKEVQVRQKWFGNPSHNEFSTGIRLRHEPFAAIVETDVGPSRSKGTQGPEKENSKNSEVVTN